MNIEKQLRSTDLASLVLEKSLIEDESILIRDLIAKMRERHTAHALLTRAGRLQGILTERDVVRRVLRDEALLGEPAALIMTADPVCLEASSSLADAVRTMSEGSFRHVVVLDSEGAILGCAQHADVVAYLCDFFADRVLNLPPNPEQRATARDGA